MTQVKAWLMMIGLVAIVLVSLSAGAFVSQAIG